MLTGFSDEKNGSIHPHRTKNVRCQHANCFRRSTKAVHTSHKHRDSYTILLVVHRLVSPPLWCVDGPVLIDHVRVGRALLEQLILRFDSRLPRRWYSIGLIKRGASCRQSVSDENAHVHSLSADSERYSERLKKDTSTLLS